MESPLLSDTLTLIAPENLRRVLPSALQARHGEKGGNENNNGVPRFFPKGESFAKLTGAGSPTMLHIFSNATADRANARVTLSLLGGCTNGQFAGNWPGLSTVCLFGAPDRPALKNKA
ncbi:MAG: hypothetical protein PHO66_06440 [Eubacteriales bacterium]|nr:hypothetical protein [Eubacteriales bacterium]